MDTMRLILLLAIGLVGMMLVQEWQQDYGAQETREVVAESIPQAQDLPDLALAPEPIPSADILESPAESTQKNSFVRITSDVFELHISLQGASIHKALLRQYPLNQSDPDLPLALF